MLFCIYKTVAVAAPVEPSSVPATKSANTSKSVLPTSVASVKGTRFWIDVNGKNGDLFHGLSGIVEIANNITGEKINLI